MAAKRKRTAQRNAAAQAAAKSSARRTSGTPTRFPLVAGVLLGGFGTSLTMFPTGGLNPFGPPKAFVLALSATLVLVGLLLDRSALERAWRHVTASRLAWALAALVVVAALASITALSPAQALLGGFPDYRGLLSIVAYGVVGFGAVALWTAEEGATTITRAAVVASLFVAVFAALQILDVFPGGPGDGSRQWRVASTLGNASNLGVFQIGILPLLAYAALRDISPRWRWLAAIGAASSAILLLATMSRGGWLAALVVVIAAAAVALGSRRASITRVVWLAAGVIAVLVIASVIAIPVLRSRAAGLLDASSRTAQWRLSAWSSAVDMSLQRPFLGYGPDNFRYAYPPFQAPGQIDGRYGYQIVEAAHNLLLDTSAAFGLVGLALLLAVGVFSAVELVRCVRSADSAGVCYALAASLLGMAVALQFHYVTMDSGSLAALLLAGLVARQALEASVPAESPRALRVGVSGLAAVYALVSVACFLAVIGDSLVGAGLAAARNGAPWSRITSPLRSAAAIAPWEPQFRRAEGTSATAVLIERNDPEAARDGIAALDEVIAARPLDVVFASERANLLLSAGLAAKDPKLLEQAAAAFARVEKMDPNTGVAMAGRASALLALGRARQSIPVFERALELSPRYRLGWSNLSRAYESVGLTKKAERAAKKAGDR